MDTLKALPQIESLLQNEAIASWFSLIGRPLVVAQAREVLEHIRTACKETNRCAPPLADIVRSIEDACASLYGKRLTNVINATGVVLHTNLGRSPLEKEIWDAAAALNCGYSNIEYDLQTGKRGRRSGLAPKLLAELTGAEAAMAVNNNASALYLILSALASGREVIVSRGEQVQIGGGFRIPDILKFSGARIVEVGTTNVTTAEDYRSAITPRTAMILQVHRSNFALRGFSATPDIKDIARIKPEHVILCADQGSGVTTETLPGEIPARLYLSKGADLVCFSGDKVLGGPQAGLIAGKEVLIKKLSRHPLYRVCRPGKTVYSLLEEVLVRRLNGMPGAAAKMAGIPQPELKKMARKLLSGLKRENFDIVDSVMTTGGGSSPDETFPSISIRVNLEGKPEEILKRLRCWKPPIIGMIHDGKPCLNMAAIYPEDFVTIRNALRSLLEEV